jgi:very-short-patch-repair endonuclease
VPRVAAPARDRARSLRAESTDAERALWRLLRDRQLGGWKFGRQHPIPPWTADFACPDARLVVEVDGGQHMQGADEARDADLAAKGWRVLRFWNDQVLKEPEAVAEAILRALGEEPSPQPSPSARERGHDAGGRDGRHG